MKKLEYIGVTLAAAGFSMLSFGYLFAGFITGFISCLFLITYFKHFKMNGLLALQFYFFCANIYGIFNNI
jgi:hypothetical protein